MRYPDLIKFINTIIEQRGVNTTLTKEERSHYELALRRNLLLEPLMLFYPEYYKEWNKILYNTQEHPVDFLDVHHHSRSSSRIDAKKWLIQKYPSKNQNFSWFFGLFDSAHQEVKNFLDEIIVQVNKDIYNNILLFQEKHRCIQKAQDLAKK